MLLSCRAEVKNKLEWLLKRFFDPMSIQSICSVCEIIVTEKNFQQVSQC